MGNTFAKNSIEGSRSVDAKIGTKTLKDKFSKPKTVSHENVLNLLVDTGKKFMKGDVVKIEDNVVKFFTGDEIATDNVVAGIVKIGNWQTDGYTYVYVLVEGIDYVYVTEEVNAGDKLLPADDNTTPTPLKRYVKKATDTENPYWIALEHSDANSFVKAKFLTQGGKEYGAMFKVISDDMTVPSIKVVDGRLPTGIVSCGIVMVSNENAVVEPTVVNIGAGFIDLEDGYLVLYYHIKNPGTVPELALGKDDASVADPFEILTLAEFLDVLPNGDCGRTLIARVYATEVGTNLYSVSISQEHYGPVYGTIFGPCPE